LKLYLNILFSKVKLRHALSVVVVTILLTSCFANQSRMQRYNNIEAKLKQGNTEASLALVKDPKKYSKKDLLIYYMDNGALNSYAKKNKEAFQYLEKADRYQEELYTQSVSANISTYLINDNQRSYAGEDFEILYLNVLKAISFIEDNNNEGAMVEIRKGINKLSVFEIRYQKQLNKLKESTPKEFKGSDGSTSYESNIGKYDLADSALLRLLSMILHRDDNLPDDAEIDKRKIEEIRRLYSGIYNFNNVDLNQIQLEKPKDKVLVDIFAFSGLTAQKKPWNLDVVTSNGVMYVTSNTPGRHYSTFLPFYGRVGSFSISIPYIERRHNRIQSAILFVDGKQEKQLNLIEKTSNMAINQFEKQKNFIVMKSLIRATAKAVATYELQEQARKKRENGEDDTAYAIAGLFSSVFASATEVADIRSWNTLPDNCYFGEVALDEGQHDIEIHYLDQFNNTVNIYKKTINLDRRNKTNLITSYAL
jgi:hypothetical protein